MKRFAKRRTRGKSGRNRQTSRSRSIAARKGWITRRRNARREFLRRSRASKKGWRRRKAKAKIQEAAKAVSTIRKGRLKEWLVTWIYNAREGPPRQVDFTVIARSSNDALLFVLNAVDAKQDSQGADLTWMTKDIPEWHEAFAVELEGQNATLSKDEIKALGEGYVTVN